MRGTTAIEITVALVWSAALMGCTRDASEDELSARCEVHLDELTWPVVDLVELTGRESPSERCDLFLVKRDPPQEELRYQRVEPERWTAECSGEGEAPRNCALEIDPLLAMSFDDGLLMCEPAQGRACADRRAGTRTQCAVSGDLTLLEAAEPEAPRNVVAVDTFEGAPDLAAVTWVAGVYGDVRLFVSFLRRDGDGWTADPEIDVCQACPVEEGGAPNAEYTSFQTATRGDRVLLAGPCGSSALVEVGPDGSCLAHRVVEEMDAARPEVTLSVVETGLAATPYMTVWTDGVGIFSSLLDEDLRVTSPAREHWRERVTESRESPGAACYDVEVEGEAAPRESCVVMWSAVTRLPDDSGDPGDVSLQWRRVYPAVGEGLWETTRWTLDEGSDGRFALEPRGTEGGARGILLSRHPVYGLLARGWSDDGRGAPSRLRFADAATQLALGAEVADFTVAPVAEGAHVAAWTGTTGDERPRLVALLSDEPGGTPATTELDLAAVELPAMAAPPQRPLLATGATEAGGTPLLVGLRASAESCDHTLATATARVDRASASPTLELGDAGVVTLSSAGGCDGCAGAAIWAGECALVALPGAERADLYRLCPGAEPRALEVPDHWTQGGCDLALWSSADGDRVILASDGRDRPGLSVWEGRLDGEGFIWRTVSLSDAGGADALGQDPRFAAHRDGDEPLLLWTEAPYGAWPQRNLRTGRIATLGTGEVLLERRADAGRDIADSRAAVAAVTPVPCSSDQPQGDLCAFIALSRPDPVEVVEDTWYNPFIYLTPLVVGEVVDVTDEVSFCDACGPVELVDEEIWRGLPTTLLPQPISRVTGRLPGLAKPLGVFAEVPPTVWDRGSVSAFDFSRGQGLGPEGLVTIWQADGIEPYWLVGDDVMGSAARSLRLASSDRDLAATWVVTHDVAGGRQEDTVGFALVDEELRPTSRAIVLGSWPSQPATDPHPDVRWLMAEHLQVGLGSVGADEFMVAWTSRPTEGPAAIHASRITCAPQPLAQRSR